MFPTIYVRESTWHSKFRILEPDWQLRDRPAACYRPAIFLRDFHLVALSFPPEKFGALVEDVTNLFSYLLKLRV